MHQRCYDRRSRFQSATIWGAVMRLKTVTTVIALMAVPFVLMAQDHKDPLLQDLYRLSGMERQLDQLPMIIQVGFDQAVDADNQLQALPRSVIDQMRASIAAAYEPQTVRRTILRECHARLSIVDLNTVLAWLDSPLGRKITRLEEAASRPDALAGMQRYAQALQDAPPTPERLDMIRQLDAAVKATETGVEVAFNTQIAVAMAVAASLPVEQQPDHAQLTAALEQRRPQIRNMVRGQTLIALLYTYQQVSEADLSEYIAFAASPAGTIYHDASIAGFKAALLEGGYRWGQSIGEILSLSVKKVDV